MRLLIVMSVVVVVAAGASFAGGAIAYRDNLPPVNWWRAAHPVPTAPYPGAEHHKDRADTFRHFPVTADVVMVGDSITEYADWHDLLPGVSIANRGIAWDTTERVLDRMDTIFSTRASTAFLMAGANDVASGAAVPAIAERHQEIVRALAAKMRVVVFSVLYTRTPEWNNKITLLNQQIENFCTSGACTFVDLNEAIAPDGAMPLDMSADGTHLNGSGYARWVAAIKRFLQW